MENLNRLKEAEKNFEIAINHFNFAEFPFIDTAIEELNRALNNLNEIRKSMGMTSIEI